MAMNVRMCCECSNRPATFPKAMPVHCCDRCYDSVEQAADIQHSKECDERYAKQRIE